MDKIVTIEKIEYSEEDYCNLSKIFDDEIEELKSQKGVSELIAMLQAEKEFIRSVMAAGLPTPMIVWPANAIDNVN